MRSPAVRGAIPPSASRTLRPGTRTPASSATPVTNAPATAVTTAHRPTHDRGQDRRQVPAPDRAPLAGLVPDFVGTGSPRRRTRSCTATPTRRPSCCARQSRASTSPVAKSASTPGARKCARLRRRARVIPPSASPTSRPGIRARDVAPGPSSVRQRLRRPQRTGRCTSAATTVAGCRQQAAHLRPCSCRTLSALDHRQREPGPARRQRHDGRLSALYDVGLQLRRSPGQPRCHGRQCCDFAPTQSRRRLRRRDRPRPTLPRCRTRAS